MTYKVRKATIDDAKDIHQIHTSAVRMACKDFYTAEQISVWLEGRSAKGYHEGIKKGEMFVAEEDGKTIGFCHAVPGEIFAIFVDPHFHGKGVGKLLFEHGFNIAKDEHENVRIESTLNAEQFYSKHGFVKVKEGSVTRRGVEIPIIVMEYSAQ